MTKFFLFLSCLFFFSLSAFAEIQYSLADIDFMATISHMRYEHLQLRMSKAKYDVPGEIEGGHAFGCQSAFSYLVQAESDLEMTTPCQATKFLEYAAAPLLAEQCSIHSTETAPIIAAADKKATTLCQAYGHKNCKTAHSVIYTTDKQCAVLSEASGIKDYASSCDQFIRALGMVQHAVRLHSNPNNCEAWIAKENHAIKLIEGIEL